MLVLAPAGPPQVLVGPEVADVVAGHHQHPVAAALVVELREQRHQLEQLVGLEQQVGVVDRVAHRHRELELPVRRSDLDHVLEDPRQVADRLGPDLRVYAGIQAQLARATECEEAVVERPGHPAHSVVVLA